MLTGVTRKIKELWRGRTEPSEPAVCSETACSAESTPAVCTITPEQIAGMSDEELIREIHHAYDGTAEIELIEELESRWGEEKTALKIALGGPTRMPKQRGTKAAVTRSKKAATITPEVTVDMTAAEHALIGLETRLWQKHEIDRIIAEQHDPRNRLFMNLSAYAGLRPREIVDLQVQDLNASKKILYIRKHAENPPRRIEIAPWLVADILKYAGDRVSGQLFRGCTPDGSFTITTLLGVYDKYTPKGFTAWVLRWHFAVFMYRYTRDMAATMSYIGLNPIQHGMAMKKITAMTELYERMLAKAEQTQKKE